MQRIRAQKGKNLPLRTHANEKGNLRDLNVKLHSMFSQYKLIDSYRGQQLCVVYCDSDLLLSSKILLLIINEIVANLNSEPGEPSIEFNPFNLCINNKARMTTECET